ncbi:hypothetical protein [Vulgatibacter sp.]|uniref:hypothetical protein n=1 Tax=Vulgatibacter sp. TaxID=1971226 RepID=UPI003563ACA2
MEKHLPFADADEALPEIESNEVVLVSDTTAGPRGETVEEVTARLEALLADTRGELGARLAELEGEVEALRETEALHVQEIEELQAQLASREAPRAEGGGNATLLSMLHAELSAAQSDRERLAAQLAEVEADREAIQDDLAAQIANLAGQLAARDAELAAVQRKAGGPAQAGGDEALAARVEDLEAENGFLQAEIDRLAAQVAATRR